MSARRASRSQPLPSESSQGDPKADKHQQKKPSSFSLSASSSHSAAEQKAASHTESQTSTSHSSTSRTFRSRTTSDSAAAINHSQQQPSPSSSPKSATPAAAANHISNRKRKASDQTTAVKPKQEEQSIEKKSRTSHSSKSSHEDRDSIAQRILQQEAENTRVSPSPEIEEEEEQQEQLEDVDDEERKNQDGEAGDDGEEEYAEDGEEEEEQKEQYEESDSDDDSAAVMTASNLSGPFAYQPSLLPLAEIPPIDSSDPYSSADSRATLLLSQLNAQFLPKQLIGMESQEQELYELLNRTMNASQNNATLLLGARGSGKSCLLEHCLRRLKREWQPLAKSFVVVRLNGMIQTDDTLAMREIIYQLCEDMDIVQLKESMDFHAHLSFLLEVLEQGRFNDLPIFFILDEFHLFTQRNKQTLLYNLCDLLQSSKAQIGIVGLTPQLDVYESLEKRVRSRMSHRRILMGAQTAQVQQQSTETSDLGNVEHRALSIKQAHEKKYQILKEILLQRLLILPADPANANKVKSEPETTQTAATSNEVTPMELDDDSQNHHTKEEEKKSNSKHKLKTNQKHDASFTLDSKALASAPSSTPKSTSLLSHNASVTSLLDSTTSPRLYATISYHLSLGFPVSYFLKSARLAVVVALQQRHPFLTEEDLLWSLQEWKRDWMYESLRHCTMLELTLLTSMSQLSATAGITHQNFHIIYQNYQKFFVKQSIGTSSASQSLSALHFFTEDCALKAFESLLIDQVLLVWNESVPTNSLGEIDPKYAGQYIQKRFLPVKLLITPRELQRAFKTKLVQAPTWLVQWACKGAD